MISPNRLILLLFSSKPPKSPSNPTIPHFSDNLFENSSDNSSDNSSQTHNSTHNTKQFPSFPSKSISSALPLFNTRDRHGKMVKQPVSHPPSEYFIDPPTGMIKEDPDSVLNFLQHEDESALTEDTDQEISESFLPPPDSIPKPPDISDLPEDDKQLFENIWLEFQKNMSENLKNDNEKSIHDSIDSLIDDTISSQLEKLDTIPEISNVPEGLSSSDIDTDVKHPEISTQVQDRISNDFGFPDLPEGVGIEAEPIIDQINKLHYQEDQKDFLHPELQTQAQQVQDDLEQDPIRFAEMYYQKKIGSQKSIQQLAEETREFIIDPITGDSLGANDPYVEKILKLTRQLSFAPPHNAELRENLEKILQDKQYDGVRTTPEMKQAIDALEMELAAIEDLESEFEQKIEEQVPIPPIFSVEHDSEDARNIRALRAARLKGTTADSLAKAILLEDELRQQFPSAVKTADTVLDMTKDPVGVTQRSGSQFEAFQVGIDMYRSENIDVENPMKYFENDNIQPTVQNFNKLIRMLAQKNAPEAALHVVTHEMFEKNVSPNAATFTALATAGARSDPIRLDIVEFATSLSEWYQAQLYQLFHVDLPDLGYFAFSTAHQTATEIDQSQTFPENATENAAESATENAIEPSSQTLSHSSAQTTQTIENSPSQSVVTQETQKNTSEPIFIQIEQEKELIAQPNVQKQINQESLLAIPEFEPESDWKTLQIYHNHTVSPCITIKPPEKLELPSLGKKHANILPGDLYEFKDDFEDFEDEVDWQDVLKTALNSVKSVDSVNLGNSVDSTTTTNNSKAEPEDSFINSSDQSKPILNVPKIVEKSMKLSKSKKKMLKMQDIQKYPEKWKNSTQVKIQDNPRIAVQVPIPFFRQILGAVAQAKTLFSNQDIEPEDMYEAIQQLNLSIAQAAPVGGGPTVTSLWTYTILIEAYGRVNRPVAAFKILQRCIDDPDLPNPDREMFSAVIKAFSRNKKYEKAWDVYYLMRNHGHLPDQVVYSQMMDICARGGLAEKAQLLFDESEWMNVPPNEVVFNSLIKALSKRIDQYPQVFKAYYNMISRGFRPDGYTFLALIDATSRIGDPRRSLWLLNEMRKRKIPRHRVHYNAAVTACARHIENIAGFAKPGEQNAWMQEAQNIVYQDMGIKEGYDSLIEKVGMNQIARQYFGLDPNIASDTQEMYSIVQQRYSQVVGDLKRAETILEKAVLADDGDSPVDDSSISHPTSQDVEQNHLSKIKSSKLSIPDQLNELFKAGNLIAKAQKNHPNTLLNPAPPIPGVGIPIETDTCNALLSSFTKGLRLNQAELQFQQLFQNQKPDAKSFSLMIEMYLKSKKKTKEGMILLYKNFTFNHATKKALTQFLPPSQLALFNAVTRQLDPRTKRLKPTFELFIKIIDLLARQKSFTSAIAFLYAMNASGFKPKPQHVSRLLRASRLYPSLSFQVKKAINTTPETLQDVLDASISIALKTRRNSGRRRGLAAKINREIW